MKLKYKAISITGIGICITLLLAAGSGCNKLVEIPANSPGQLTTSSVFLDSATATSAVVGIYTSAYSQNSPLSLFMSVYPSLSADDLTSSNSATDPFISNSLSAGSNTIPGGSSGFIWDGFYNNTLIYQTNAAIDGLSSSTILTTTLKNQLIGECEVIRALAYFYLTNLYGSVPIAISTDYAVTGKLPRSSADSVYAQITKDLVDAGGRLLVAYPSEGRARPNMYTALALLSRVYLYQQQWGLAKSTKAAIIHLGN
jgi:starch-binding outer membrane protein, SusD/RagB family